MTSANASVMPTLESELLCLADTKLVIGNWLVECTLNGRALPDFSALLGMASSSYGDARALYQLLSDGREQYVHLERGRGSDEIYSMNLLDAPPQNWEDFVVTLWLCESATWTMLSGFLHHSNRVIGALARKLGEDAYFKIKYSLGWSRFLAGDPESRTQLEDSLAVRYPLALDWFGPRGGTDPLAEAQDRDKSIDELRDAFCGDVDDEVTALELAALSASRLESDAPWRPAARRRGPLPKALFEVIRFKDQLWAH